MFEDQYFIALANYRQRAKLIVAIRRKHRQLGLEVPQLINSLSEREAEHFPNPVQVYNLDNESINRFLAAVIEMLKIYLLNT